MPAYPDENSWWPDFERQCEALYAEAGQTINWAAFRWSARVAFDIGAGTDPEVSKARHLAELRSALGLDRPSVPGGTGATLPGRPSRMDVCGIQNHFQGLTLSTQQFGPDRQWFDPDVAACVTPEDRYAFYALHRSVGDTHIVLSLDQGGLDTLPRILMIATEAITRGGLTGILLCCMGDGQKVRDEPWGGDNDPGALGKEWLMANFDAIHQACCDVVIGDHTLADHIVFSPGFDGCVPGWQRPSSNDVWILHARAIIDSRGHGHLAHYFSAGYCVWGDDGGNVEHNNWNTPAGLAVDVAVQEGPPDMAPPDPFPAGPWADVPNEEKKRWTQVYQMIGRMVRPFHPLPGQPDDPAPPFLLAMETPRGPRVYVFLEFDTFPWTGPWRKGMRPMAVETVERHRQVIHEMGVEYVG